MKTKVPVLTIFILLSLLLGLFCFFPNNNKLSIVFAQNNITVQEAQKKIETRFQMYDIEEIKYMGEGSDTLGTYNFRIKFKDKDEFCVQVTKQGGYILTLGCLAQNISNLLIEQQCLKAVEEFVHQIGFFDLRAIWSTTLKDETIINLAPIINDVIIYPDLLKIRVNCKSGDILSLEARSYLYDYYRGVIDSLQPILTYEQAKESIPEGYEIKSYRLALILDEKDKKCLTYQIETKRDGFTYYFFIDANNGEIEEVFPAV